MSHDVETFAYAYDAESSDFAYKVPWHGLGVPVEKTMTPYEMLDAAGLNWTIERQQNYIFPPYVKGKNKGQPNFNAEPKYTGRDTLVRSTDGKILTHVPPNWEFPQNHDMAEFFCGIEGIEMNTMGSLVSESTIKNLADIETVRVFALAKINKEFSLFNGKDPVRAYLLFSLPHQYGKGFEIRFTPIRVVCANTMAVALGRGNQDFSVRFDHKKKFDPEEAKKALGIAQMKMDKYKEAAEFLATKKTKMDDLINYYKEVFPNNAKSEKHADAMSRQAELAHNNLEKQPGAELGEGTWWQAFNAATYTVDHLAGKTENSRMISAWFGAGRNAKGRALEKAVEYAEAS